MVGQAHQFLKGNNGNEAFGEVIKANLFVDLFFNLFLRPLYFLRLPLPEILLKYVQILLLDLLDFKIDGPFLEFAFHEFEHQPHVCHHLLFHFLEVGSYDVF